jgi:hypothetical protein
MNMLEAVHRTALTKPSGRVFGQATATALNPSS